MTAYETLSNAPTSLCNWFKHLKIYKIIGIILLLLFLVPLITHYYLLTVSLSFCPFAFTDKHKSLCTLFRWNRMVRIVIFIVPGHNSMRTKILVV